MPVRHGIDLIGVDAHPGMLAHLQQRLPNLEAHLARMESLDLGRRFDLVIGPSSILTGPANLKAAARHLTPGGRAGLELMNPHWLDAGDHPAVRETPTDLEIDYQLPDGSTVTQVVNDWHRGPAPEEIEAHLKPAGLALQWMGGGPNLDLQENPTYFVPAG